MKNSSSPTAMPAASFSDVWRFLDSYKFSFPCKFQDAQHLNILISGQIEIERDFFAIVNLAARELLRGEAARQDNFKKWEHALAFSCTFIFIGINCPYLFLRLLFFGETSSTFPSIPRSTARSSSALNIFFLSSFFLSFFSS